MGCSAESSDENDETEYVAHNVTFVSDEDCDGLSNPTVKVYNTLLGWEKPNPSRTGYTLDGWYEVVDIAKGTLSETKFDFSAKITKDITLKAKWKPIKYTIHFNANGGSQTSDDISDIICEYDENVTLPINSFEAPYGFKKAAGWCDTYVEKNVDKVSENVKVYASGATVKNLCTYDSGTITLYALYSVGDWSVTFKSFDDAIIKRLGFDTDETITEENIPYVAKRTGYTFDGWYEVIDAENGTLSETKFDFPAQITKDITLKVQWKPIKYTIHFDANTCTGTAPQDISLEYDKDVVLPMNTLSKQTGYKINGWNTYEGYESYNGTISYSSGKHYDGGATVKNLSATDGATVTLYSQYELDTDIEYTITLESEYGNLTASQKSFKVKHNDTIYQAGYYGNNALPTLSENGYDFGKWAVKGETTYFDVSQKVTSDMTFVALWTPYSAIIHFYPNKPLNTSYSYPKGGSSYYTQNINFGEETPLKANGYKVYKNSSAAGGGDKGKMYYRFKGWTKNRTPTADEKYYVDGEVYVWNDSNVTEKYYTKIDLYAQWEENPISLDILIPTVTSDKDLKCSYDSEKKQINVSLVGFSGTYYLYVDGNTTPSLTSVAEAGKGSFDPFSLTNLASGTHTFYITAEKDGIEYSQTLVVKIVEK